MFTITNEQIHITGTSAQLELKRFEMLEHLVRRTLDEAALRGDLSTVRSIMGLAQTFCLKTEKEPKIFLLHRLRDHPIWQYSAFWISAIFEAVSYERVKFNSSTVSPRSSDRNKTGKVRNFLTRRNRRKSDPSQVRDPVETEMMTFAVRDVRAWCWSALEHQQSKGYSRISTLEHQNTGTQSVSIHDVQVRNASRQNDAYFEKVLWYLSIETIW